jgi:hypothetical protein
MRILSLATAGALAIGLAVAASAFAQAGAAKPHKKVFGYQDAETGAFHPLSRVTPDVTAAPLTGTIEVTFTITLKTAVPSGGSVYCTTDIAASSINDTTGTSSDYDETSFTVAKVTGSTATCTVNTPYSWVLAAASSTVQDSLVGSYTVGILPPSTSTALLPAQDDRSSSSTFLNVTKLPAAGAISKYTVSATL